MRLRCGDSRVAAILSFAACYLPSATGGPHSGPVASPHEAPSRVHGAGLTAPRAHRDAFRLPAVDSSVAEARRRVLDCLRSWGVAAESREDAELLVSELFTNAIRHTDSERVGCELWMIGVRLRLEVTDEGGQARRTLPRARAVAQHARQAAESAPEDTTGEPPGAAAGPDTSGDGESGRGLLLVSVLADEWGIRPDEQDRGHAVWAELPCVRTVG